MFRGAGRIYPPVGVVLVVYGFVLLTCRGCVVLAMIRHSSVEDAHGNRLELLGSIGLQIMLVKHMESVIAWVWRSLKANLMST
jgi:hypothetical protein